jgi:hypothetical protein
MLKPKTCVKRSRGAGGVLVKTYLNKMGTLVLVVPFRLSLNTLGRNTLRTAKQYPFVNKDPTRPASQQASEQANRQASEQTSQARDITHACARDYMPHIRMAAFSTP